MTPRCSMRLTWATATSLGLAAILIAVAPRSARSQEQAAATSPPAADNSAETPADELSVPLIERTPFDRITLDQANDNATIETELLDFPNRELPSPRPDSGEVEFHRLKDPSFLYEVAWESVAQVELYEQMVRDEAERQLAAGDFAAAFETLVFLRKNYPNLPGLEDLLQRALWREASSLFAAGKPAEALPALVALAERNARFARLSKAVDAVANSLIEAKIKARDYAGARQMLDAMNSSFSAVERPALAAWQERFRRDAQRELARARDALADRDYAAARAAVNAARAIMPDSADARAAWREIQAAAPEIRVGVFVRGQQSAGKRPLDWASARLSELTDPRLVDLVDFGAEGGVYRSPWVELASDDVELRTAIRLTPAGRSIHILPEALALRLATLAAGERGGDATLASSLRKVALLEGDEVVAYWQRRVLRPEALLGVSLDRLVSARQSSSGAWYHRIAATDREITFSTTRPNDGAAGGSRNLVEHVQDDEVAALTALRSGDVDVVERVPPWQIDEARSAADVVVAEYRLPTVHLLIPNMNRPLMALRDFRRALAYAIDRERIVQETLCAGSLKAGYRPLSGPFLAGVGRGDPAGYGYDQSLAAWPYEPRLAMVLANVARAGLAKREADAKKKSLDAAEKESPGEAPDAEAKPLTARPPKPLTLVHAADPLARAGCQAIQANLSLAGIAIKLVETTDLSPADPAVRDNYDLAYVEVAPWEPLVDARRLLGRGGLVGASDPLVDEALDALDRAETWNDARAALKQIHALVRQNLPVIPLWQTPNSFAHRKDLAGVGRRPVSLYQNVADWKKSLD